MARTLWGKVYCGDRFAGLLQQEPGGGTVFAYDESYLEARGPAIAHTLPLTATPYRSQAPLPPFFDNLVAEGWLRNAQARALGVPPEDRFALLLAFGRDCAGAVSVIDPEPVDGLTLDPVDQAVVAALAARASLSGVQPKLLVVRRASGFRPAGPQETATHIAKLPAGELPELIALEYLTSEAVRKLLPEEPVAEMEIGAIANLAAEALIVRRFDRTPDGAKRHFEDFNQLLGRAAADKYDAAYEDMGRFFRATPRCIPAEAERLFRRVLACLLTGNTDAHLKNFAMFHTAEGLRLTPSYDLVAAAHYRQFDTVALALAGAENRRLSELQPKHVAALGQGWALPPRAIALAVEDLSKRREAAIAAIDDSPVGTASLRGSLIDLMEKRWNGTFASIGRLLSKKRGGGAKR